MVRVAADDDGVAWKHHGRWCFWCLPPIKVERVSLQEKEASQFMMFSSVLGHGAGHGCTTVTLGTLFLMECHSFHCGKNQMTVGHLPIRRNPL
jgi:hypothetical protein